jgi:hypothetical protein
MKLLHQFWLKRMDTLADAAPALYYPLLRILAAIGFSYLALFPIITLFTLTFIGYIAWQTPLFEWGAAEWIFSMTLLAIAGLAGWTSIAISRLRPELPPGKPLLSGDFPTLLNRINELCTTYNSPYIEHIRLTTRFDIELVRTPTSGFPLRFTNTLLIGLPVMSCMSPLHLKLLLARQIGHLALSRKQPNRRIIYLRHVWQQYANIYARERRVETVLLRLFVGWFAGLFMNSTRAAMRLENLVRDKCLLDITPAEKAAEAIAIYEIKKRFVEEEFWPELNDKAYTHANPPYLPYSEMDNIMCKELDERNARIYFEKETSRTALTGDERPGLRQRLARLQHEDITIPGHKADNAAHHFFGKSLGVIQKQLDNVWYLQNKTIWNNRHKQGLAEKQQLKSLREQAAKALLSNAEARLYLQLLNKYVAAETALPLCYEVLKTNSLDAGVCFEVGRILLSANDARGIEALNMAMDISSSLTIDCCQQIIKYMVKKGDMRNAQQYRRMILAHQVAS